MGNIASSPDYLALALLHCEPCATEDNMNFKHRDGKPSPGLGWGLIAFRRTRRTSGLSFRNAAGAIAFRATRRMNSFSTAFYELHSCNRAGAFASRARIIGGRNA
jgi:hypothetical protein